MTEYIDTYGTQMYAILHTDYYIVHQDLCIYTVFQPKGGTMMLLYPLILKFTPKNTVLQH